MLMVFFTDCVLARGTFNATNSKQSALPDENTTALLSLWLFSTRNAEICMLQRLINRYKCTIKGKVNLNDFEQCRMLSFERNPDFTKRYSTPVLYSSTMYSVQPLLTNPSDLHSLYIFVTNCRKHIAVKSNSALSAVVGEW